jgi:hypothetical protein
MYRNFVLAALLLGALGIGACSKSTDLGLGLVDEDQADLVTTDTFTVELYTEAVDSVLTYPKNRYFCGRNEDPLFGTTEATMYLAFRLTNTNVNFPDGAVLDSLVLGIAYDFDGHAGNYNQLQTWEVLRLEEAMDPDTVYFSDVNFATGAVLKANHTFLPRWKQKLTIKDTTGRDSLVEPQLRIRLDDALGQEFLNADSALFANTNSFREYFKGVVVRPVDGAPNDALIRFNTASLSSKMVLYYREANGKKRVYEFPLNGTTPKAMRVTHDYAGTQVLSANPTDSLVYLQGLGGTRLRVSIPSAAALENVIINKAELVVQVAELDNSMYYPSPRLLFASYRNEEGNLTLLPEFVSQSQPNIGFFGGQIDEALGNGRADILELFRMNISKTFQRLVDGTLPEPYIYLDVAFSNEVPYRVVLGNHRHTRLKPKLSLIFTRFPQ